MHSNLLYAMNYISHYDPPAIFAEHLKWDSGHAEPLTAQAKPHVKGGAANRRLRIGYVSPHFREHAVNYFVEPILASHNHREFEIVCYSDVPSADRTTKRLQSHADNWRDTADALGRTPGRTDSRRQDRHPGGPGRTIGGNRLLVFARKPAPVQVTYIGYQNTTGMSAMDYRLTDERADPPGLTDAWHTERLVRLPQRFFCYRPGDDPRPSRCRRATNGYVTFGSFNSFFKVSARRARGLAADFSTRVPRFAIAGAGQSRRLRGKSLS